MLFSTQKDYPPLYANAPASSAPGGLARESRYVYPAVVVTVVVVPPSSVVDVVVVVVLPAAAPDLGAGVA